MSVNLQCKRCRMTFATRELLLTHSEVQHGDFMQSRTRAEYLKFRRDRGDDVTMAEQIPIGSFMSVYKLKALIRAGKAKSDLYGVRVRAVRKRRKQKANCPTCGKPVDTKYGRKYHKDCRPSIYERKRPEKEKTEDSALVKGKRRRRCKAPDCDVLFYPKSNRQKYHPNCRQARKSRAVPL